MDIGLARVSTLDQDPRLQLDALKRAGCDPIFIERVSGAAAKRPVRDEALELAQPGDTFAVWKLDRLGRSLVELQAIVTDLERRGVKFRSLTENIDTSTAQGRLFFLLLASFAEFERALIIERTKAGKARRAAEGKHPGGRRRFGVEDDHSTIREAEARLLCEAARRLLDGETASSVVEDWNDRGIPAQHGGRWQVSPLRTMLKNPRVVPVLGADTYRRLLELFDAPDRRRQGRPAEHLLSGILRCQCGQPMYSVDTGKGQSAYRCQKAKGSGGRSRGCGTVGVSERAADRWATEAFIVAMCSPALAERIAARLEAFGAGGPSPAQLAAEQEELAELELIMRTRFATDAHRARREELRARAREAQERMRARPDLAALGSLPRTEAKLRDRWDGWTVPKRRMWLKRVLRYITLAKATQRGRGSDVGARLNPIWKV